MKKIVFLIFCMTFCTGFNFKMMFKKRVIFNGSIYSYFESNLPKSCYDYKFPNSNKYLPAKQSGIYKIQLISDGSHVDVYCDMETSGGGWTRLNTKLNNNILMNDWIDSSHTAGSMSRLGLNYTSDTNPLNGPLVAVNSNAPVGGGCAANINGYNAVQFTSFTYNQFSPNEVLIYAKNYVNSGTYSECGGVVPDAINVEFISSGSFHNVSSVKGLCGAANGSRYMDVAGTNTGFKTWKQSIANIGQPFMRPFNVCGMNFPNNYYQINDIFVR